MFQIGDKVKKEFFLRGNLPGGGRFLQKDYYYGKVVDIQNDSYLIVKWRHGRTLATERVGDLISVSDHEWRLMLRL